MAEEQINSKSYARYCVRNQYYSLNILTKMYNCTVNTKQRKATHYIGIAIKTDFLTQLS